MLETQKRENYKNEYDRLRGAMLAGVVGNSSKKFIYQRMGNLNELARESLHGKKHEVFMPKKYEKTDAERLNEANRKVKK